MRSNMVRSPAHLERLGSNFVEFPVLARLFKRASKESDSDLLRAVEDCKVLARTIKSHRVPSFVFPQVGQHLPLRLIADSLVNCYLRTFESIYRVVHIPTFWAEYEKYWEAPSEAKPVFVILTQLSWLLGHASSMTHIHSVHRRLTGSTRHRYG